MMFIFSKSKLEFVFRKYDVLSEVDVEALDMYFKSHICGHTSHKLESAIEKW